MNLDTEQMKNLKNVTYLDNACMGIVDRGILDKIKAKINKIGSIEKSPTQITYDLNYKYQKKAREAAAKLMDVKKQSIALMESTTHSMSLIIRLIDLSPRDNILIPDCEFLGNRLLWKKRSEKIGFKVRVVPTEGRIEPEKFIPYVDKNTKAVILSSVQEVNGYRIDINEFAKLSKNYEFYLILDGIQEAGVMDIKKHKDKVDFYCTGGHKWLRSPFGMGFLYVKPALLGKLSPPTYGYFNAEEPSLGWEDYLASSNTDPAVDLQMSKTARKFETGGTGNYTGAVSLFFNIEKILEDNIKDIEQEVLSLNKYLLNALKDLSLNIVSPLKGKHQSGIVCFNFNGNVGLEKKFKNDCLENNIYVSLRYNKQTGGIRVSPHYYNKKEDLDKFLEFLEWFIKKNRIF